MFASSNECVSGHSSSEPDARLSHVLPSQRLCSDLLHQNIVTLCFSGQHAGLNHFTVSRGLQRGDTLITEY